MRALLYMIAGIAIGISTTIACSDDSPPHADAATCACPMAEPPLGNRISEVIESRMLPPSGESNGRGGLGALCPEGSILLTGGCTAGTGQVPDIVIEQNSPIPRELGSSGNAWGCSWRNNTTQPVQVRVIARCLVPAP